MSDRPIAVLIAALGGEGGGVLTDWIVAAAMAADLPVSATLDPRRRAAHRRHDLLCRDFPRLTHAALGGRKPLFGLYPSPGGIDLMLASEVIEAGRALELGFVTPDRTILAAATHRIYAVVEKSAMADGRFDASRILDAAASLARRPILFDLTRSARTRELSLNAVLLGIAAASGVLPMPRENFVAAIRESGIAVAANLAAFELGCALAEAGVPTELQPRDDRARSPLDRDATALIGTVHRDFPAEAAPLVEEGVRRLVDYQDLAYARRYYERARKVAALDRDGALTASVARHLALWMAYEDVIRVADLKTRPERFAKVRAEIRARPDEPVRVREFLKPGLDEIGAVLPAPHRRRAGALVEPPRQPVLSADEASKHDGVGLSAAVATGADATDAAHQLSLRRGGSRDRGVAQRDRRRGCDRPCLGARDRRMRAAPQRL